MDCYIKENGTLVDDERFIHLVRGGTYTEFTDRLDQCLDSGRVPVISDHQVLEAHLDKTRAGVLPLLESEFATEDRKPYYIISTSGTTGTPRLYKFTRDSVLAHTNATMKRMGYGMGTKVLSIVPPWSSYGFSLYCLKRLKGVDVCFSRPGRISSLLYFIKEEKIASLEAFPDIYRILNNHFASKPQDTVLLESVETFCSGGEKLPPAILARFTALTGKLILDGYGLTEAGPNVAIACRDNYRPGSVGTFLPGIEYKICDKQILHIRSPFQGIPLGQEAEYCFINTGDIVRYDGHLEILGRYDNLIYNRGKTISPEYFEGQFNTLFEKYNFIIRKNGKHLCLYVSEELNDQELARLRASTPFREVGISKIQFSMSQGANGKTIVNL
ncbi:AMP-binding protein [Photorhabdus tasmaniensis]|uniref:AMP-dependent synthetase/ligase domain-containing protein n=1 Tax=Photorhabdus tasmaniensis TaxID=1004159 RepID=A0ABX0GKF5_9GAMM|nr:AMP-binding protein [Photorhabdus tasmaniensis]NHB89324.1 hypothetical protein [Photorhabdus tasmaniensis]